MKLAIIFPPLPLGWTPVTPPILEYLAALTRRFDPTIKIRLISASATSAEPLNKSALGTLLKFVYLRCELLKR